MIAHFNLKKGWLSLQLFNLLLACFLSSAVNFSFYEHLAGLSSFAGFSQLIFVFCTFLTLTAFYFLILELISWRYSAKIVAVILIILAGFASYFVNQLGVNINADQIQNVAQTDVHEAWDLLSIPLLSWLAFTVILPLILIYCVRIKPAASLKHLFIDKFAGLACALFVMGLSIFAYYSQYAPIFRENRELKTQISPLNIISSSLSYVHKTATVEKLPLIPYGTDAHQIHHASSSTAKIMVLVVGETARAQNFSLNGYARMTNPELSQLDLVNFTQASSCGTQTSVSVPCMFSGMPRQDYDAKLASHREGLLDLAQRAGYQVTWIDNNSGCKGACDRIKNVIVPKDEPRYQEWCKSGECDDVVLLKALDNYLKTLDLQKLKQSQLIVLHQMGSHGPAYYKRYPEQYKKFQPTCESNNIQNCDHDALINTYDNTILYTDHLVASAIHLLDAIKQPTSLMYLSDHGESTGEKGLYLHGTPYFMAPKEQTHIPMLIWTSKQWSQHEQIQSCLRQQKDSPVSQDNLFPTVLGLLNVQSRVIDQKLNLLTSCKGIT